MPVLSRARARIARNRATLRELVAILRVLTTPRHVRVVGYTKAHPIYTDVFEKHPPSGYIFYHRARTPWLAPLDRRIWRRISLLHLDAASPRDQETTAPVIMECEGCPREEMFDDHAIRHIFVESAWAGGAYLDAGRVTLLRPSVPPRAVRAQRRREGGEIVLVAVGHGGMIKGIDVLARVYDAIKDELPVRLVIAGSLGHNFDHYPEITREAYRAAEFPVLEQRFRADPRVTLKPFTRRQLFSCVYPRGDIYVHLSRLETFGYSILEAMTHALPVVATRLHAIPEMVRNGETGFLIDVDDLDINGKDWQERVFAGALHAVQRLARDAELRRRLGENGRARAMRAFDIDQKRKALALVYDRAIDSVTAPRHVPPRAVAIGAQ